MSLKHFISISLLFIIILVGCSQPAPEPTPEVRDVQVVLVNSEISPGQNRFAIALFDQAQQFIHDATVQFEYFDLSDANAPVAESTAKATRRQSADGFTTIYAHSRPFERVGDWGVQVKVLFPDGAIAQQGISFVVTDSATSMPVGLLAPSIETPTAVSAGGDLSLITTALEPEPAFYELSLDEALQNNAPTLVYFSTPAFCQTRLCGPGYDELVDFYEQSGDDFNIIHVEVFTDLPNPAEAGWPLAPAMQAFGLTTEPWLYVMDETGEVVYRVEGLFTAVELTETLPELLN